MVGTSLCLGIVGTAAQALLTQLMRRVHGDGCVEAGCIEIRLDFTKNRLQQINSL